MEIVIVLGMLAMAVFWAMALSGALE